MTERAADHLEREVVPSRHPGRHADARAHHQGEVAHPVRASEDGKVGLALRPPDPASQGAVLVQDPLEPSPEVRVPLAMASKVVASNPNTSPRIVASSRTRVRTGSASPIASRA